MTINSKPWEWNLVVFWLVIPLLSWMTESSDDYYGRRSIRCTCILMISELYSCSFIRKDIFPSLRNIPNQLLPICSFHSAIILHYIILRLSAISRNVLSYLLTSWILSLWMFSKALALSARMPDMSSIIIDMRWSDTVAVSCSSWAHRDEIIMTNGITATR